MFRYSLPFIFLISTTTLQAQHKRLSMEDAILNARTRLAPANLSQLGWIKNSISYYYVDNRLSDATLFVGDDGIVHGRMIKSLDFLTGTKSLNMIKHSMPFVIQEFCCCLIVHRKKIPTL